MPSLRTPSLTGLIVVVATLATLAGACGGGSTEPPVAQVQVEGFEMSFEPVEIRVPEGRVEFTFVNGGTVPHTFVIQQRGFKLEAFEPEATDTGVADLPEGAYFTYCDIRGHREQGMEGTLFVGDVERPER
jgi:plastocyanin